VLPFCLGQSSHQETPRLPIPKLQRVNHPIPAIVTQEAVRRLPRLALLLFCLAYALPGFVGRNPWRSADITAFGYMRELALGHTAWLTPKLMDVPLQIDALLPYWLGAWSLWLSPSWIAPDFAVRIPFIALLALSLAAVWQAVYRLARSPAAQPVAFAFGGEARPADYARAMADGGLLAFIACLGLAQLSHETTPALAQMCFAALLFYAVAAAGTPRPSAILSGAVGVLGLTLSGAPSQAMLIGAGSILILLLDREGRPPHRALLWLAVPTLLAAALASGLDLWRWRLHWPPTDWARWNGLGSLLLWFTWPAWPLVLWTLWRWRRQLFSLQLSRHLALPLWFALVTVGTTVLTPAGDRALLLALPALATLAAFALPTLDRSVSALVDWFTLLFFTSSAIVIWVVWIAMQTGWPPQPAANVARLLPGFEPRFVILPFVFATLATLAWIWLVRWRVGRHRSAIWKSLVLPAGGAALCWLLLTTLWMPALDHARSFAPLVRKIESLVRPADCIETFGLSPGLMTGLAFHSDLRLEPTTDRASCPWLIVDQGLHSQTPEIISPARWSRVMQMGHPRAGEEDIVIFQRLAADER